MSESTPSENVPSSDASAVPSPKSVKVFLPLVILALPIVVLWGFDTEEVNVAPTSAAEQQGEETAGGEVELTDEDFRQLIVGSWEMDRDGKRFLTVHPDGTADMNVEVSSNWSFLFGKQLKFDIEWTIVDGVLTMKATGGEPKGKVDILTNMYGAERVQAIKILDETTLRLPDDEPEGEDHIWTRVEP